jgi:hypothetical protein
MFGLQTTGNNIVQCYATEDAGRIVNWPYYNLHPRNYNHSQLFLTLLHVYTIYKHYTLIFTVLLYIKSPN